MSTLPVPSVLRVDAGAAWLPWAVAALGFALMYVPVYWGASTGLGAIWQSEENAHGPIILAVTLWLLWIKRAALAAVPARPARVAGWASFGLGLLVYTFGRTFNVSSAEFASQILVMASIVLLLKGGMGLRVLWFPTFYLVFMVPLPGTLVDMLTGTLKHWISHIVESLLFAAGYPIGRSGVVMTIGPYELLVADACSGLHSMFSLSALGTLFMYIMKRPSVLHNAVMLAAILPVAFVANIIRVMILVLLTYHFGDEVGQGFLHGAAGLVLMFIALCFMFALDGVLNLLLGSRQHARA
jgi:exosortase B